MQSARLCLQLMIDLPVRHPWLHKKFKHCGFHSVWRSDRYWLGLSTDLAIEQVLMKAVKSRGGLTHGRGLTDSVRLLCVCSMHKCVSIHAALATLTGTDCISSDIRYSPC